MGILEQLEEGLGCRPKRFARRPNGAAQADMLRVIGLRQSAPMEHSWPKPNQAEIWPLISHHGFNAQSLFGVGKKGNVYRKTLAILLAHDGIVASDPLVEVERLLEIGRSDAALNTFSTIVGQVALVEPLIDKGLLRFESARPSFHEEKRLSILRLYNLPPDLLPFSNFEQAYPDAVYYGASAEREYVGQAREFYRVMGLPVPQILSADDARRAVHEMASALIHVSWQLAVCASQPHCDMTISGTLEHRIVDTIMAHLRGPIDIRDVGRQRERTRHVSRLSLGSLPNLDTTDLSVADAISIRRGDAFGSFRNKLRFAMDDLSRDSINNELKSDGKVIFEEKMQEASRELKQKVKGESLSNRLKPNSMDAAIGLVVGGITQIPALDIGLATAVGAGATLTSTILQWLVGRDPGQKVALRYFSSLGGQS